MVSILGLSKVIEPWNSEERKQQLVDAVRKYEHVPLVDASMNNGDRLLQGVRRFYDIRIDTEYVPRWGPIEHYRLNPAEPEKQDKTPEELISIIEPFMKEQFNRQKLSYGSVREDYKRWYNAPRHFLRGTALLGTMGIATFGAAPIALYEYFGEGSLPKTITALGSAAILLAAHWKMMMEDFPVPRKTDRSLDEFFRLEQGAMAAGAFIETVYKERSKWFSDDA